MQMPSGGLLRQVGRLPGDHLSGVGWRYLVWLARMGSKARGRPGCDGFWCVAGSVQICVAWILVFVKRSHQAVLSIY